MSEQSTRRRSHLVVHVPSDDDRPSPQLNRRVSVVEILSDESDNELNHASNDNDIEIVSETDLVPESDDIEITGLRVATPFQIPHQPAPSRRRRSPDSPNTRSTRRRTFRFGLPMPPAFTAEQRAIMLQMLGAQDLFGLPNDELSSSIMERLEREDDHMLDSKIENENIHNRKQLKAKQETAKNELEGYTNTVRKDVNLLCELCGITLGEGIPSDFEPNPFYDDHFLQHAEHWRLNAPWFCVRQCTDTDRDLSKRVFAAKCGHTFCGRCIKNIGNRPAGRQLKKQRELMSVVNPLISAPKNCPAVGCGVNFSKAKRTFTELFM